MHKLNFVLFQNFRTLKVNNSSGSRHGISNFNLCALDLLCITARFDLYCMKCYNYKTMFLLGLGNYKYQMFILCNLGLTTLLFVGTRSTVWTVEFDLMVYFMSSIRATEYRVGFSVIFLIFFSWIFLIKFV